MVLSVTVGELRVSPFLAAQGLATRKVWRISEPTNGGARLAADACM